MRQIPVTAAFQRGQDMERRLLPMFGFFGQMFGQFQHTVGKNRSGRSIQQRLIAAKIAVGHPPGTLQSSFDIDGGTAGSL